MMKKPDSLKDLRVRLERVYGRQHAKIKRSRDIYNKRFQNLPQLPQDVPVYESSTGRNLVDNLADNIRTDEPHVYFAARGTSKEAGKHKELMERWGQHILEQMPLYSLVNPSEQAKKDLLHSLSACVKFTVDTDRMGDPPVRSSFKSKKAFDRAYDEWRLEDASTWQFRIRAIDPLQVLTAPVLDTDPPFYLERQQRVAYSVAQEHPAWVDKKDNPYRMVEWLEYWDSEHYIVEVDGQRVIDEMNPYGAPPYAFVYNGLGRSDVAGDPEFWGESILEPIMGELEAEVRLMTAMDVAWQFHVFPRLITTKPAKVARAEFQKGPGAIISIASMEQKPEWLEQPPPNQDMLRFLAQIKESIAARFPPSLTQRPSGVEAAVHQALLLGQALKPLQPVKTALNALMSKVLNGLAQQMVAMQLRMNVFGTSVKSEKSREVSYKDFTHFNFQVKYEATDPAEDERKLLTGVALLRVPRLLSRKDFREVFAKALGIKHEEAELNVMVEMLMDRAVDSGMLDQALLQEVAHQEAENTAEALGPEMKAQATQQFVSGARERGLEQLGAGPQEGPSAIANEAAGGIL